MFLYGSHVCLLFLFCSYQCSFYVYYVFYFVDVLCVALEMIRTEHYLTCNGLSYLRRKCGVTVKDTLKADDSYTLRRVSEYLRYVTRIIGLSKKEKEEEWT